MRLASAIAISLIASSLVLAACGGGGDDDKPSPTATAEPTEEATPTPGPVTAGELARSVVEILPLDSAGDPVWFGSGTLISEDGLILTNAHVVDDRFDEYEELAVAVTEESDQPPDLAYLAEIVAVDYVLDLAVIQVVSTIDGGDVDAEFPFIELGDSDSVEIGDEIRVLGYPGIGGETITFTNGVISGFTSERSIDGRAWIKTDATIAGGNSGGLAVNAAGVLVGVPTIVGSGSDQDTVDCRLISDTNRDGTIDELDTCVPVGGFINGLRPVNLAAPLISAAEAGEVYVSEFDEPDPTPSGGFDTDEVFVESITFALGVTEDDEPIDVVEAAPSAATEVCAFWDYEGMADGMTWEGVWFIDGTLSEDASFLDQTWVGGESGVWWACIFDETAGLADGLYEFIVSVEGDPERSNSIFVGGDHPPITVVVDNTSSFDICFVYLSPSGAQNWGGDELGAENVLLSGNSFEFETPAATYDILTVDCDGETVTEDYEVDLFEDSTYTITDV
jgi:S1-C subfamily serine protease